MGRLAAYLPMDRRHELAGGEAVPDRARGVALFADLAGFTQLTDRLATSLGPEQGAEELTRLLDAVLGGIVERVHRYHGSVVDFGGDGVVAWFAGDVRRAALTAALDMDDVVRAAAGAAAEGLRVKVALVHGNVRRFIVGDPQVQLMDVLAGPLMDELAAAERLARSGDVVVAERFLDGLGQDVRLGEPREDPRSSARVLPVLGIGDNGAGPAAA